MRAMHRIRSAYRAHRIFVWLWILLVALRAFGVVLFRPGGFIADFSDYDFYWTWAGLIPAGYRPYETLFTAYPPLFPWVAIRIYHLASALPPWEDPRLFFHLFLGWTLLLFEAGNLLLLYRLGRKLARPETGATGPGAETSISSLMPLVPPLLYGISFAPLYTMLGWFEPMNLFFFLLGLDLLLEPRERIGRWSLSAVALGLGFLVKMTPLVLLPAALRWLGLRLSWRSIREEWFDERSPHNLHDALTYGLLTLLTVLTGAMVLAPDNPWGALTIPLRVLQVRPPWQSLWALWDGYTGYGLVPLDRRNPAGLGAPLWESRIPWGWVALAFLALYLWLYTRPYDWRRRSTPATFAGVSVLLLLLFNKGWSPQFVLWPIALVALFLPNPTGIVAILALTAINVVESQIYLILLPQQTAILWSTVLLRTALLVGLTGILLARIWPGGARERLVRGGRALVWATVLVGLLLGVAALPAGLGAYRERRLAEHPCPGLVTYLQAQAEWPEQVLATGQVDVWRWLRPWLDEVYDLRLVDAYSPGQAPDMALAQRLDELGQDQRAFWWIERSDGEPADVPRWAQTYMAQESVHRLPGERFGPCRADRVFRTPPSPWAVASVEGGPIELLWVGHDTVVAPGQTLHLVLYWRAVSPVRESYTVFTQVLDSENRILAQQDNPPVEGTLPTDRWQPGQVVRDPYRLALPVGLEPGSYRVILGLYTPAGRQRFTLADGETAEFVQIRVRVRE